MMKSLLSALAPVAAVGVCFLALPAAAADGQGKILHPIDAPMGPKHGRPACLDWDTNQIFKSPDWDNGYKHYGANLHVYDNCIPDSNQVWFIDGKSISTYVADRKTGQQTSEGRSKFCMDFNRGDVVEGKGHRVIGWSDCHGAAIQQWTIHDSGAISVDWEGRTFCLTWDGDNDAWNSDVFAAECEPSNPSRPQIWQVIDK